MHHTNATKVTEENCIMVEAGKVLDCLTMKRFFFQEQLLQRILMPIQNIDGYIRSTMQEIFTFVGGYTHKQTSLNILFKIFRRHSF